MKNLSISEYKRFYFDTSKKIPGEHHFVAVYLLNKFNRIPDYLNPDGTKGICGDIVFTDKCNKKSFSIEVKLGKTSFCFSKKENNSWFIDKTEPVPNYLIALTQNRLFIIKWHLFSDFFIKLKNPRKIESKSGNSLRISEMDLLAEFKKCSFEIDSAREEDINESFNELNKEIENFWKM